MTIETILTPAEQPALARRDLRGAACVVFDILRATSTFVTALHNGAREIIPVGEIAEAVRLRRAQPPVLLAGERAGIRIRAEQTGGVDFDFGNSPREFTSAKIQGASIVSTTTNGTRALRACLGAKAVLAASFLNLAATADFLQAGNYSEVILVCAGTGEGVALEDVLAAGALIDLWLQAAPGSAAKIKDEKGQELLDDSSQIALKTFNQMKADLSKAISSSQNGRRLLGIPELRDDVRFCAQRDIFNDVALMGTDGTIRRYKN